MVDNICTTFENAPDFGALNMNDGIKIGQDTRALPHTNAASELLLEEIMAPNLDACNACYLLVSGPLHVTFMRRYSLVIN